MDGITLRDTFLFRPDIKSDMLVPCGGRPETFNSTNFHKLFPENKPKFK